MAGQNFIGAGYLELWNAYSQSKQVNKGTNKWSNLPNGLQWNSEEENLSFEFAVSSVPWTKSKWVCKVEIPLFLHVMKVVVFAHNIILHKENKIMFVSLCSELCFYKDGLCLES